MRRENPRADRANLYRDIDFRRDPEAYRIGRGEEGVLTAEPYKSEILPHWRFRTPAEARKSSRQIYRMFLAYLRADDFVGADMARKFLQMGWTRARRYANHPSGRKYAKGRAVKAQAADALTSEKAQSAAIFFKVYRQACVHPRYVKLRAGFQDFVLALRSKP